MISTAWARLRGWLWDRSSLWRRPLRHGRDRWRAAQDRRQGHPPQVATGGAPGGPRPPLAHPAIGVIAAGATQEDITRFLRGQTESSVIRIDLASPAEETAPPPATDLPFCFSADHDLDLPAVHLEGLLMIAAAEDLPLAVAGWAGPVEASHDLDTRPPLQASRMLLRNGGRGRAATTGVIGRTGCHVTEAHPPDIGAEVLPGRGPYLLDPGAAAPPATPIVPVDRRLSLLPAVPGPPTILFLLPYLAVGGAERQLLDVIDHLTEDDRHRALVVTLEPHRADLGQTVDACRARTPHVYPLGDWLPRAAHESTLRHLLRRYHVSTLVSWNGTVLFYDRVDAWRAAFPDLRILNQVYNHEGGWIDHYGPRVRGAVDVHLAVNSRIAEALAQRHGVAPARIETVFPAGRLLPPVSDAQRTERRTALGLPTDAFVVGTFVRMHPQKRPST